VNSHIHSYINDVDKSTGNDDIEQDNQNELDNDDKLNNNSNNTSESIDKQIEDINNNKIEKDDTDSKEFATMFYEHFEDLKNSETLTLILEPNETKVLYFKSNIVISLEDQMTSKGKWGKALNNSDNSQNDISQI